jgi:uncharacterized protein (DUF2252 family)
MPSGRVVVAIRSPDPDTVSPMSISRPVLAAISLALPVALTATLASPAQATISLTRDPVAFIYAKDHALSLLNNHATDDDLSARTTKLASSAWAFFHGNSSELTYRLTSSGTSDLDYSLIQDSKADTRADLLTKYTTLNGSVRTFQTNNPDLAAVDSTTGTNVINAINAIASYRTTAISPFTTAEAAVKDVVRRKNAGTGSLGRFRWYALLEGKTTATDDDRIMELKQEVDPAPKQLAPNATTYTGGQRPALALEWLSYQSDNKAGWASVGSVPVLVKEKSPYAEDLAITDLTSSTIWNDTIRDDARLLAAGHAAADQDLAGTGLTYSADAAIDNAITSVSGLQSETRTFANDYATQVTNDWQAYVTAKNNGTPLY